MSLSAFLMLCTEYDRSFQFSHCRCGTHCLSCTENDQRTACKVEFILYGSFARTYHGHGTDRALLGGIMGFSTDDMRIRNSFEIATENGLKYSLLRMRKKLIFIRIPSILL